MSLQRKRRDLIFSLQGKRRERNLLEEEKREINLPAEEEERKKCFLCRGKGEKSSLWGGKERNKSFSVEEKKRNILFAEKKERKKAPWRGKERNKPFSAEAGRAPTPKRCREQHKRSNTRSKTITEIPIQASREKQKQNPRNAKAISDYPKGGRVLWFFFFPSQEPDAANPLGMRCSERCGVRCSGMDRRTWVLIMWSEHNSEQICAVSCPVWGGFGLIYTLNLFRVKIHLCESGTSRPASHTPWNSFVLYGDKGILWVLLQPGRVTLGTRLFGVQCLRRKGR